jgi:plastocyanin
VDCRFRGADGDCSCSAFTRIAYGQGECATGVSFALGTLTVAVGTTVTWTNRDDIPHTVVSTNGVFKSKVRDTDEKFSYTFTKAGDYPYFCSIHPKMTGTVVVQ